MTSAGRGLDRLHTPPREGALKNQREPQVSPRSLHERLGFDQPHRQASTSSAIGSDFSLFNRVQGVVPSTRDARASRSALPADVSTGAKSSSEVGQDRRSSRNSSRPAFLGMRIAHSDKGWPTRGQRSSWNPPGQLPRPSSEKSLDRSTNRHLSSSRETPSMTTQAAAQQPQQPEIQGRIRVSEEGDVWRSPPARPTLARNSSSASSLNLSEGSSTIREEVHKQSTSSAAAHEPIDLTKPTSSVMDKSGFSPLPPFARAGLGSESGTTEKGLFRGIPPQGFRKQSHYDRSASRPPQIAESSRSHESSRADRYRPSSSYRDSRPYPLRQDNDRSAQNSRSYDHRSKYDSRDTSWGRPRSPPLSRGKERVRYDEWSNPRGDSVLANPTKKQPNHLVGEEIPTGPSRTYANATWVRRPSGPIPTATDGQSPTISPTMKQDRQKEPSSAAAVPHGEADLEVKPSPRAEAEAIPAAAAAAASSAPASASISRTLKQEGQSSIPSSRLDGDSRDSSSSSTTGTGKVDSLTHPSQPYTSSSRIKAEPGSPPPPSEIPLPPRPADSRPLFNPVTQSPEERKPVLHYEASLPPRPSFVAAANLPVHLNKSTAQSSSLSSPAHPAHTLTLPGVPERTDPAIQPEDVSTRASLPPSQTVNREVSRSPPSKFAHSTNDGTSIAVARQDISQNTGEPDMEVDELDDDTPAPPVAGPSRHRPPHASQLPSVSAKDPSLPRADSLSTVSAKGHSHLPSFVKSGKGKKRARESSLSSSAGATSSEMQKVRSVESDVISLGSDDDLPELIEQKPAAKSAQKKAFTSVKSRETARTPTISPNIPSPALPETRAQITREERTRAFHLPAKVYEDVKNCGQPGSKPSKALSMFIDEKYEELELELQSPLRRIDEICRDDNVRLIFIEVDLAENEIAVQLPKDCLKSAAPKNQERTERRQNFSIQQVVKFAKEGREAETTRYTPAHLIIVFKTDMKATSAHVSATSQSLNSFPKAGQPSKASSELSASNRLVPSTAAPKAAVRVLSNEDKKRKRQGENRIQDDAASISSVGSTASSVGPSSKVPAAKVARKTIEPLKEASTIVASRPSSTTQSASAASVSNKLKATPFATSRRQGAEVALKPAPEVRGTFSYPRVEGFAHSMHGSLSHSLKDTREKPRSFFYSDALEHYIAVSMRGHLHHWAKNMSTAVLSSEDQQMHASLSIQAALWSDESRLAVLSSVSGSAAAVANVQLVRFKKDMSKGVRRTVIEATGNDDKTGLSALAWLPSKSGSLTMASADQSLRRLRLWSVDPGTSSKNASLTPLVNMHTRHTNSIRSILWLPQRNKIYTGGADKRICTVDPITNQVVDEWKESSPINRMYQRDANTIMLCLANNRDQFRCIDLRAPFSAKAITLSEATERGESLGQYAHGHLMDDYFAYPIGEELHIWDLRYAKHLQTIKTLSGGVQPHWESQRRLILLEKKHFTALSM